jgi:hypothetical protein
MRLITKQFSPSELLDSGGDCPGTSWAGSPVRGDGVEVGGAASGLDGDDDVIDSTYVHAGEESSRTSADALPEARP